MAGLAIKRDDDELPEKISISRSSFERTKDRDLAIKGESILNLVGRKAMDLTERGSLAEKLSVVNQRLASQNADLATQGGSIAQRQGALRNVEDLFKETEMLLREEIDALLKNVRGIIRNSTPSTIRQDKLKN